MADCLAYWKTFWREYGPTKAREHACSIGYGSREEHFLSKIAEGDNLWIVGRSEDDTAWRLLQRLHVARTYTDSDGKQRVIADDSKSDFFDPESQADFEEALKQLQFASDQPISASGARIGLHIQPVRPLSDADRSVLVERATHLRRL